MCTLDLKICCVVCLFSFCASLFHWSFKYQLGLRSVTSGSQAPCTILYLRPRRGTLLRTWPHDRSSCIQDRDPSVPSALLAQRSGGRTHHFFEFFISLAFLRLNRDVFPSNLYIVNKSDLRYSEYSDSAPVLDLLSSVSYLLAFLFLIQSTQSLLFI